MLKFTFSLVAIALANLAWMGFVREPLPPVPEICAQLSEEVDLDFSISSMNATGVELALTKKVEGKGMYVVFKMANAWKTGRPGLVVSGIRVDSGLQQGMAPQKYLDDPQRKAKQGKDFSDFMKDKRGNAVSRYSFQQALVEGAGGQTFLRMSYDGPAMEMIQTLEIPRPVTVPGHISRQFVDKGVIQFQPGTVAFDPSIQGFYIPVLIRG